MSKVTDFIESNIELIDAENWNTFFARARVILTQYNMPELRQVFDSCGINPLKYIDIIPEQWFSNDETLTYVDIPEGIKEIKGAAFYQCTKLESVSLPSTLTSLGYYTFEKCYKLDNIDLSNYPNTSLGSRIFADCSSLKNLKLPKCLEHMGTSTFAGCMNLRTITFPETLKVIDKETFIKCQLLEDINFEGTIEQWKLVRRYDRAFVGVPAKTIKCKDGITKLRPTTNWQG